MNVISSEIKRCPICQLKPRECRTIDTSWPHMLECDGSAGDPHPVIYSGWHPRVAEAIAAWNAAVTSYRPPRSRSQGVPE